MKIAYCLNGIHSLGGIPQVVCAKANALAALPGNEVYLILTDYHPEAPQPKLSGVHVIDLQVGHWDNDSPSLFYALSARARRKRVLHRQRLRDCLQQMQPDVVISPGQSEKYIVPLISKNERWVTIREYHYARGYRLRYARFQSNYRLSAYLLAIVGNLYQRLFNRQHPYDATVVLTRQDAEENYSSTERAKLTTIPNPLTLNSVRFSNHRSRIVVCAARLEPIKQFDHLIAAWKQVATKHPDWQLHIYGSGTAQPQLEQCIHTAKLSNSVILKGRSYDMGSALSSGCFFAYCSAFEGFPLVLLEAMSCALPVISYACPCGPADIIRDGYNGYLVPLNDIDAMAARINELIEHPELVQHLAIGAVETAARHSIDRIAEQWMELFRTLLHRKHHTRP